MVITSEIKKIEEMSQAKWVIPYHDGSAGLSAGKSGRSQDRPGPDKHAMSHSPVN